MNLSIPAELLSPKQPCNPHLSDALWEKKTLNLFRGVIESRATQMSAVEIGNHVRRIVKEEFKPGFFLPFAFGAIVHLDSTPPAISDIAKLIDTKARWRDTWQWVIVCDNNRKKAFGVHTWLHGYLRPVYEDLLAQLESAGYNCTSQDRAVDNLFVQLEKSRARLLKLKNALLLVAVVIGVVLIIGKLFFGG
ncbi:MAG TPA: hypothetical protein VFU31_12810 [Candidatus Binatia bacterium]|nr:hypothetical protein [Candidatus Binatia bacterium]